MSSDRSHGKVWFRVVAVAALSMLIASCLFVLGSRYPNRPVVVVGAVVQQDDDPRNQSPINDVEVTAGDEAASASKTNLSGYFKLPLRPGIRRGQLITLHFRHSRYQALDLRSAVGDNLYVVRMTPTHADAGEAPAEHDETAVTNVLVRYSTLTSAEMNVGTGLKTFQVVNVGDVPCHSPAPCSPDGQWKAATASASLDAGPGNVFEDARVFCIAGPCPFTKIESDGFSKGGQNITVSVRNWSDTATFLFEAEIFRQEVSGIIRQSYPVIFGQTFDFSLPGQAEGPSLEAELDGTAITFPLGPDPKLSWASCGVSFGKDRSKSYRCELKPGYKFK